jgi:hypothetical protein
VETINPPTVLTLFNNTLNSLQKYNIAQNDWIVHIVVQRLSQINLTIFHCRHTYSLGNQNSD